MARAGEDAGARGREQRRPAIGFVFGLLAILLIRVGLFELGTPTTDTVNWGFVVGILAGFGASEFADRSPRVD